MLVLRKVHLPVVDSRRYVCVCVLKCLCTLTRCKVCVSMLVERGVCLCVSMLDLRALCLFGVLMGMYLGSKRSAPLLGVRFACDCIILGHVNPGYVLR